VVDITLPFLVVARFIEHLLKQPHKWGNYKSKTQILRHSVPQNDKTHPICHPER